MKALCVGLVALLAMNLAYAQTSEVNKIDEIESMLNGKLTPLSAVKITKDRVIKKTIKKTKYFADAYLLHGPSHRELFKSMEYDQSLYQQHLVSFLKDEKKCLEDWLGEFWSIRTDSNCFVPVVVPLVPNNFYSDKYNYAIGAQKEPIFIPFHTKSKIILISRGETETEEQILDEQATAQENSQLSEQELECVNLQTKNLRSALMDEQLKKKLDFLKVNSVQIKLPSEVPEKTIEFKKGDEEITLIVSTNQTGTCYVNDRQGIEKAIKEIKLTQKEELERMLKK